MRDDTQGKPHGAAEAGQALKKSGCRLEVSKGALAFGETKTGHSCRLSAVSRQLNLLKYLVGVRGFEPPAPASRRQIEDPELRNGIKRLDDSLLAAARML
jgi:hypothetical protein